MFTFGALLSGYFGVLYNTTVLFANVVNHSFIDFEIPNKHFDNEFYRGKYHTDFSRLEFFDNL